MSKQNTEPTYVIVPDGQPPEGYPVEAIADTYQETPEGKIFGQRRREYIQHVLKNPSPKNTKPAFYELVRMVGGARAHEGVFNAALSYINKRRDCSDFVLHGVLRLLYQFANTEHPTNNNPIQFSVKYPPSSSLLARAEETILKFKYFPNEPGVDSMCTWTENHYILFTSAAYLAGQLFPDSVFTNSGETGLEKMALNRPRILKWMGLRFKTGFSEWLSNVYYDEDLTALLSLYDLADDPEIRDKAEKIIHLILLDLALNQFKGVFGSTHGRSYEKQKKWAAKEDLTDTLKLLFGMGIYTCEDCMSAPSLVLSGYRVPNVIVEIAQDDQNTYASKQRMGIELRDAEGFGLKTDNFEDGMHFLTMEAYFHPKTINNTIDMFDTCQWWRNDFFKPLRPYQTLLKAARRLGLLPWIAKVFERDLTRNTREVVNILTYRTPDTMLSSAQDYQPGFGGDQQHIWQATLGPDAVCFTQHPVLSEQGTPDYWSGSGLLPRVAQFKNLAIAIYNLKNIPAIYVPIKQFFTHAWLPLDCFDDSKEVGGWIFARKGNGYLALSSMQPYVWHRKKAKIDGAHLRKADEDFNREVIAAGKQNIWVCQLGRSAENGSFGQFIDEITEAKLVFKGLSIDYRAPGIGNVNFGWKDPFLVNGEAVNLDGYPRYANPYSEAAYGSKIITIEKGEEKLKINWSVL